MPYTQFFLSLWMTESLKFKGSVLSVYPIAFLTGLLLFLLQADQALNTRYSPYLSALSFSLISSQDAITTHFITITLWSKTWIHFPSCNVALHLQYPSPQWHQICWMYGELIWSVPLQTHDLRSSFGPQCPKLPSLPGSFFFALCPFRRWLGDFISETKGRPTLSSSLLLQP